MVRRTTRVVTDEQFSDQLTVDGLRMGRAIKDTVDRFNDIPPRDIHQRWLPNTLVHGWSPNPTGSTFTNRFPWLNVKNDLSGEVVGTAPDALQNGFRFKGSVIPGSDLQQSAPAQNQLAYVTRLYFKRPVILHSWDFMFLQDSAGEVVEYSNDYLYTAPAPPGFNAGDSTEDVNLIIDIDSPFGSERKTLNNILVARRNFQVAEEVISGFAMPNAGFTDMGIGAYPGGTPTGFYMPIDGGEFGLNIALPRDSRIRVIVILPKYDDVAVGAAGWGTVDSVRTGCVNSTLCYLEEVEVG